MLPVLSYTTLTGTDMATVLAGFRKTSRHFGGSMEECVVEGVSSSSSFAVEFGGYQLRTTKKKVRRLWVGRADNGLVRA